MMRHAIALSAILLGVGLAQPASAQGSGPNCSFIDWTTAPVGESGCNYLSFPGDTYSETKQVTSWGHLICPGGDPTLFYESRTEQFTGNGTCYGINVFEPAQFFIGRCNPRWTIDRGYGTPHTLIIRWDNASVFLAPLPVCYWPSYEARYHTVSQRNCDEAPCYVEESRYRDYWEPSGVNCWIHWLVIDYYRCSGDDCTYLYSEWIFVGEFCP